MRARQVLWPHAKARAMNRHEFCRGLFLLSRGRVGRETGVPVVILTGGDRR